MSDPSLRGRLPTILAEAVSVVFAVLVALAVDEWWEERENVQFAEETVAAIAEEIRQNRAQLLEDRAGVDPSEQRAGLDSAIAAYRAGTEPTDLELTVNWNVALLSSAAWESAQVTGATRHMELSRVIDLAQMYEFQRYYSRDQEALSSLISDFGARLEGSPLETLLRLRSRLRTVSALRGTLSTTYACMLAELEGPDAVEEGACPRPVRPDSTPEEAARGRPGGGP